MNLTIPTQELLDSLVKDYTSTTDRHEFKYADAASYIYNLFRGGYNFSASQFRELYGFLSAGKQPYDVDKKCNEAITRLHNWIDAYDTPQQAQHRANSKSLAEWEALKSEKVEARTRDLAEVEKYLQTFVKDLVT